MKFVSVAPMSAIALLSSGRERGSLSLLLKVALNYFDTINCLYHENINPYIFAVALVLDNMQRGVHCKTPLLTFYDYVVIGALLAKIYDVIRTPGKVLSRNPRKPVGGIVMMPHISDIVSPNQ